MSLTNRTFGIELECMRPRGMALSTVANAITRAFEEAGIAATADDVSYTHRVSSYWKVTTDQSLGYDRGAEIVSPVLSGEDGMRQVEIVCKAVRSINCKVDEKCGYHVHIGAADLTHDQMAATMLNYVWFEDFFDHIVPPSRRRDDSRWVKSNRRLCGGSYGTDAVNTCFPLIQEALKRAKSGDDCSWGWGDGPGAFRDGTRDHGMEHLVKAFTGANRYVKMNLYTGYLAGEHRPGNKCIEFRQHSGTLDFAKVANWIRLHVAFVEKSKVSRPRPRTVTRDLTPVEEMNRFFAYLGPFLSPDVATYYRERRRALAGEATRVERETAVIMQQGERIAREMIATLGARRATVLGFRRPQTAMATRLANASHDLQYAVTGALPWGITSREQVIANAVTRTRTAFPSLFPRGSDVALAA